MVAVVHSGGIDHVAVAEATGDQIVELSHIPHPRHRLLSHDVLWLYRHFAKLVLRFLRLVASLLVVSCKERERRRKVRMEIYIRGKCLSDTR